MFDNIFSNLLKHIIAFKENGLQKKIHTCIMFYPPPISSSQKKSPTAPPGKKTEFVPVKIYNTEEYFPQSPPADQSTSTPDITESS